MLFSQKSAKFAFKQEKHKFRKENFSQWTMSKTRKNVLQSRTEEDFASPDRTENQTSYNLNYSNGDTRILDSNEQSTSNAAAKASRPHKKYYARKSTAIGPRGRQLPSETTTTNTMPSHSPSHNPHRRKQKKPLSKLQKNLRFMKEVRTLQNRTDALVPKLPFGRLVREIIHEYNPTISQISMAALEALQEATETYMTQVFSDAYTLTLHRKRVTLSVEDFDILRLLRMVN